MGKRNDVSKHIHFFSIVDEYASSLSAEFGIEIDPNQYDHKIPEQRDRSDEVMGMFYDLNYCAEEFVMGLLQKALPSKHFRKDNNKYDEAIISVAEDLRRLAGIKELPDSENEAEYSIEMKSPNKEGDANLQSQRRCINILPSETLEETISRLEKALKSAENIITTSAKGLHL